MFKSVFSRILAAFMAILLLSLAVVLLVVISGLFRESQAKKLSEMDVAANELCYFLQSIRDTSFTPTETILKSGAFAGNMQNISELIQADIRVVRSDGTVAASSSEAADQPLPPSVVAAVSENLAEGKNDYAVSNLGGYLENRKLNSFAEIRESSGDLLYLIVVTSELAERSAFAVDMTKRTAVVSIWVVFAALVCVSVISRRITKPIKQMGNAAREYAKGNFKIRVDAEGPDEIAELGKAFNHMAGSLAAHEENRNTFLSNVSHDLRTPMTTISGFVDGMLDGTISDDQRDHYLQIISGEVRRLSRLVNSLLEVSRLEAGRSLKVSDFNLTERARQVVISLADKIDAKRIDVDFDGDAEDIFVSADPDAIHQVLYNLVDNAVKFTDSGGVIGIRITETKAKDSGGKEKDKKALVRIRNTGKGIPEEEMQHIFERFYKSDRSRGLDKTGTGLGLYIVKTVLDQHGETIRVESVPDVYTEFRFTLSLAGTSGRKMKVFRFADGGPDEPQTEGKETQDKSEPAAGEPAGSDKENEKEGYLT